MAELSTVARPYAEALFAVAKQDKAGLQAWAEQVQQLADIAGIEDVRVAMADPRLEDAQRTSKFYFPVVTFFFYAFKNRWQR